MGTRGYTAYRYKKRYCVLYNHLDSYPDGLGLNILSDIPRDPKSFQRWLEEHRAFCEDHYAAHREEDDSTTTSLNWVVIDYQPHNDIFIEWTYEMDLDQVIFHINSEPMYALDNMPSEDVFLRTIASDHYGRHAPKPTLAPEHHFFSKLVSPPTVPKHPLLFNGENQAVPLHDLLCRTSRWFPCETTCKTMLELLVGRVMSSPLYRDVLRYLPSKRGIETSRNTAMWLMYSVVRRAICPVFYHHLAWKHDWEYIGGDLELPGEVAKPFWWLRKHICVRPSEYLDDEGNFQHAVAELIQEIRDFASVPVVYGIVFSLAKVTIIQVNTGDMSFRYTEATDFLPSGFASTPSTPGISALVRLGNIPATDDDLYYRKVTQLLVLQLLKTPQADKDTPNDQCSRVHQVTRNTRRICVCVHFYGPMMAALQRLRYPMPSDGKVHNQGMTSMVGGLGYTFTRMIPGARLQSVL